MHAFRNKKNAQWIWLGIVFIICAIVLAFGCKSYFSQKELFNDNGGILDVLNPNNTSVMLINMAKNKDRLDNFIEEYDHTDLVSIPFLRVEGVNGRAIDSEKYVSPYAYKELLNTERVRYRTKHYQLTRGAIGCYLSHMHCYKLIRDGKADYGIIFEDDVVFKEYNVMKMLNKYLQYIPEDWDILLMHCICYVCGKHKYYYDVQRYILMHAYVVNKKGAGKLLEALEHKPIEQQIDSELSKMAIDEKIKIYSLRHPIAVQGNGMGTTIQIPLRHMEDVNPFDLPE